MTAHARSALVTLGVAVGLVCGCGPGPDAATPDGPAWIGYVEETVQAGERAAWPGVQTRTRGRIVQRYGGFGGPDGRRAGYWSFGPASREVGDVWVFCRTGLDGCPLDERGVLAWDRIVGRAVFGSIPGDPGYSPFWRLRVVTVDDDYVKDTARSEEDVAALTGAAWTARRGHLRDFGPAIGLRQALVHLPLVLEDTKLEYGGAETLDGELPRPVLREPGWYAGRQLSFFDFTRTEGALPAAHDAAAFDASGPLVPVSAIDLLARRCEASPAPPACAALGRDRGVAFVSERSVEQDLDADDDLRDTNNVLLALPGGADPAATGFAPLHRVFVTEVAAATDAEVALIDTSGGEDVTDVRSSLDVTRLVEAGLLTRRPADGLLLDCPVQVPWHHAPSATRYPGDVPAIEIGAGDQATGFVAVEPGADFELVEGPQSRFMLTLTLRFFGVDMRSDAGRRSRPINVTVYSGGLQIGGYAGTGVLHQAPDGRWEIRGVRAELNTPIESFEDRDLWVRAYVDGGGGVPVVLPFGDPVEGSLRVHGVWRGTKVSE